MNLITKPDISARRIAAVGMYDGVHTGHRFLIDYMGVEARSRGLRPAAVTFTRHPLSLIRPLEAPGLLGSLETRVRQLGAAGAKDVILLSFNDSMRRLKAADFLKMLKDSFAIDALVLGFNNHFGHDGVNTLEQYRTIGREVGVEVIPAPEYKGPGAPVSSSSIRKLLADGNVLEAGLKLGYTYALRGRVKSGKHLGRTLGFPTANLEPYDRSNIIPRPGVYAAWVTTPDGKRRESVVNIGFRPTVDEGMSDSKPELTIEAHIIDYTGYIYDEEITVEFIDFLRPERRFPSTARLSAQVKEDIATALKRLHV